MSANESQWSDVYKGITAAIGVATTLLTAVGVSTGFALRMLRNDSPRFEIGLVLMLVGMVFTIFFKAGTKTETQKWIASIAVFLIGVGLLVWSAQAASQAEERPHIAVSSETMASGLVKVTTTVKAEGLKTEGLVYVRARGRRRVAVNPVTQVTEQATGLTPSATERPMFLIQELVLGPKADGTLESAATFEVSPALFEDVVITAFRLEDAVKKRDRDECIPVSETEIRTTPVDADAVPDDEDANNYACVRFILPRAPLRPVVSASITAGTSETAPRTFTANVSAGGVPPSKLIIVKAWFPVGATASTLMNQALGPDLAGNIKTSITVPLGSFKGDACVVVANASSDEEVRQVEQGLCKEGIILPHFVGVAIVRKN